MSGSSAPTGDEPVIGTEDFRSSAMVRSPVWLQLGSLTAHQAWANIEDYHLVAGNQLTKILEANQYEVDTSSVSLTS
jgi:hypothetical protein